MALSKLAANSFDLTDNYAFTGTTTGATSTQKLFLIKNLDASSSGTLDFVNGASSVVLDNTYKTYLFRCVNIHPATDNVAFQINFRDGGSNYDATKTTTFFHPYNYEGGSDPYLEYAGSSDLAQSTSAQRLFQGNIDTSNDSSVSGTLHLFDPSSTTFVKHFISRNNGVLHDGSNVASRSGFCAGYCNVTAAIDGVQFAMSSGNIDSGTIKMYGVV